MDTDITILNLIEKKAESQIIDDYVITALKNSFGNTDSFLIHFGVLWELRELVVNQIDNDSEQNKLYPILHTLNELIGVLGSSHEGFKEFLKLNPNI